MTWKQFLCKHIWKEIGEEFLRKEILYGVYHEEYLNYNFYAVSQECVLCKKTRIIEDTKEKKNNIKQFFYSIFC